MCLVFHPAYSCHPNAWKQKGAAHVTWSLHEKIVPDPPHTFDLPPGKSLSRAISEGIVPIEFALMNVSHYLMFAYSDSRRVLERIQDEETRQLLEHGLRAMQIAWGQADAVTLAVERQK